MKTGKVWTKAEDKILRDSYGNYPITELCKLLPHRSRDSIFQRAYRLGLTTKNRWYEASWLPEEIEIVRQHYGMLPSEDISRLYLPHRTPNAIQLIASREKISDKRTWNKAEDEIILEWYGKITNDEISKLLHNRSRYAIIHRAKKLGLNGQGRWLQAKNAAAKLKKYTVNENFFAFPLSLISCYWAGFIAADGHLDEKRISLNIRLQVKDKHHLEQFKSDIQYTGLIRDSANDGYPCSSITICCRSLIEDLKQNFLLNSQKTKYLAPPPITGDLAKAYIAGYLDGDGCFSFRSDGKSRTLKISVVGTEPLLTWIQSQFDSWTSLGRIDNQRIAIPRKLKQTISPVFDYSISGDRAIQVWEVLRHLDVPYLRRKWDKPLELVLIPEALLSTNFSLVTPPN
jgi:hypothetical protein